MGAVQCEGVGDMETKYKTHPIVEVVLLVIALAALPMGNLWANENTKYLDTVREFADNVLKYGRDIYGPKHTPLFVDGLNIHTLEPVIWIHDVNFVVGSNGMLRDARHWYRHGFIQPHPNRDHTYGEFERLKEFKVLNMRTSCLFIGLQHSRPIITAYHDA